MVTANFRGVSNLVDNLFNIAGYETSVYSDKLFGNERYLKDPDVTIKDDKLILNYDLPGATKNELEISNEDQLLIVKGIGGRYEGLKSRMKIHSDYDLTSSDASLKDGVLTVTIVKVKKPDVNKIIVK